MNIPVTTVTTHAATCDELKPSDYRDIYDELRSKAALRVFVEMIHSQYSIAWWSKYERSEIALTRPAMQELRAAVGLAPLPPTVAEVAATVDPDATIYQVGTAAASRVVMVGSDVAEPLIMRLNGHVDILSDDPPHDSDVTPVTRPQRAASRGRIVLTRPTWERLNSARLQAGLSWEQFLSPLLGEQSISACRGRCGAQGLTIPLITVQTLCGPCNDGAIGL